MLSFDSLGKITVPTAGQPQPVSTVQVLAKGFRVEVSGTGKAYFGVKGLNVGSGAGLVKTLANTPDAFVFNCASTDGEYVDLQQFMVDVQTNGDGVIVSYWK